MIWNRFVHDGFVFVEDKNTIMMAITILLIAIGGFLLCLAFDKIRELIFKIFKIDEKVVNLCNKIITRGVLHE